MFIGNYHGGIPPWASGTRTPFHSHVPTMRPRSPRLVFRDPIEPGTLTAPASFFGNGLQDIGFEDDRGLVLAFIQSNYSIFEKFSA